MKRIFVIPILMIMVAFTVSATMLRRTAAAAIPGAVFVDSGQTLGSDTTNGVAAAFLDQDQLLDIFAANSGGNRVWLNNGSGVFTHNGQMLGAANSTAVALADLNGDNDVDAVVANRDAANQVWLNNGSGTFFAGQTLGNPSSRGVAIADLTGDTLPDIYFANQITDTIWINQGNGVFIDSGQALNTDTGYDVALEDLDGDGDRDVFLANGSGTGAPDRVWINEGGSQGGAEGVFQDSGQALGFIWTSAVALGELDSTAGLDAFTASWFPTANKVWQNDGDGTFADSGQLLGNNGSLAVVLGDVDNDQDVDAIVGNNTPAGGQLWLNNGAGTFTDGGALIAANTTVSSIVLDDLNGDGAADLFLGIFGPNQVWFNQLVPTIDPSPGYLPQLIDGRGDVGQSSAIALDASGFPHISYARRELRADGFRYSVWYARWDGVRWHVEQVRVVDQLGFVDPRATAIALDSQDDPVMAFVSQTGLHVARRSGENWVVDTLDTGEILRSRVSMALDSTDNPHLVNYNIETGQLLYYVLSGAQWSVEVVNDNIVDDAFAVIALDDSDNPHVSYYFWSNREIRYAHKPLGSWQSAIVESNAVSQDHPYSSIAIDSGGNPAIAYNWNDELELKLARWNGASWSIEVVRSVTSPSAFEHENALAFDAAGNPHLVSTAKHSSHLSVVHSQWDGVAWQHQVLDESGRAGAGVSLALDAQDQLHVSYFDAQHEDLRYLTFGNPYHVVTVNGGANVTTMALGLRRGAPVVSYYDENNGLVTVAEWREPWQFDPIAFSAETVDRVTAAPWFGRQHIAHYDADSQRLIYSRWNEELQRTVIVDETGDVGRQNDIVLVGGGDFGVRIAYWDATNAWVRLAELNGTAAPVLHVNNQAPPLSADSGFLAATELPDGQVGISYYDGVNGDLRFAGWDPDTNSWRDELVDGAAADVGRLNDIALDAETGVPVIAYYDETNDAIQLAYEDAGDFVVERAVTAAGGVSHLALALAQNSRERPRILFTTAANDLLLASRTNGVWRVERIAAGGASGAVSLAIENRLHFAFADATGALRYGFRTNNLDFAELPGDPPVLGDGFYNPMDGCLAVLEWFTGDDLRRTAPPLVGPAAPAGALADGEVFANLATLFNLYPGGRHYIGLYGTHGAEMAGIALADPVLIWDAFGALQNFMPGLEALVTGEGDDVILTQAQIDDALDVWQRIAAAGSPGLSTAINGELAQYNNLQDFVGVSFDEWAIALGVQPLTDYRYLPIVSTE